MKCPIKLIPAVSEFIKKNDLVYVGVGNYDKPIFMKDGKIVCDSLDVDPDGYRRFGTHGGLDGLAGACNNSYYFIRRADAEKHFPHCLPKVRKASPKLRTEAEILREENASLKARVTELESEKEKLRAAIRALNNF